MKKQMLLTTTFVSVLLSSVVAGTLPANSVKANPIPPIYTEIAIEQPLNTTYHVNTLLLSFSVDTAYALNSYYYSLDGQERQQVENTTIILQENINAGKSPTIIRTVLDGSCVLSNLSEGWHNVTVYQISHLIGGDPEYEIPFSESIKFKIDVSSTSTEQVHFPTVIVEAVSVITLAVISVGFLVYFKKRKH